MVVDNKDPQGLSRLYISVPDNPGTTGWAMPCAPYDSSGSISIPPVGEMVWVMFEAGDPSHPVWMGWYPSS
jgi:hypothetical protein